jgi:hypothetical protein
MPKSACTSVKNILYQLDEGHQYYDPLGIHKAIKSNQVLIGGSQGKLILDKISSCSLAFTMIRHPLKRVYSTFNEKIFYQGKYSFPRVRNLLINNYGAYFSDSLEEYSLDNHRDNFLKFLNFVQDNTEDKVTFRKDAHWLPQFDLLKKYQESFCIDFIGRVENYKDDMTYILDKLGSSNAERLATLKFNEGPEYPYKYEDILSIKIQEMAHNIYRDDYLFFRYINDY